MKKPFLITLCCASLMLVTPLVGVAQENTVSNNLPEQPNDVEGLVAQIRTVVDEVLQKFGHIPMVRSLCNVIQNALGLFGLILSCIFYLIMALLLGPFVVILIYFNYDEDALNLAIVVAIFITEFDSNCNPFYPPWNLKLPFQSIYTLSETKDNINTFAGCPCLQE